MSSSSTNPQTISTSAAFECSKKPSQYFLSVTSFGLDTSGSYFDTFKRLGTRWLIDVRRIDVEWYASPSWYESVRLKATPKSGG
jgi:hypothetical protein